MNILIYIYMWTHIVTYWYFSGGTAPWSDWNHSCIRTVSYMTWHIPEQCRISNDSYIKKDQMTHALGRWPMWHDSDPRAAPYETRLILRTALSMMWRGITHSWFLICEYIYTSHHKWIYHSIWCDVWMINCETFIDEVNHCGTMESFVVRYMHVWLYAFI